MSRRGYFIGAAALVLALSFFACLSIGASLIAWPEVFAALYDFNEENFQHSIIVLQRLPRALIAMYTGAVMACCGLVLQGLIRNPLASPATFAINAGAALFVVAGIYFFDLTMMQQGLAALVGAGCGFALTIAVSRMAAGHNDPRSLGLILSGALVAMLLSGIAQAILLSDPSRRSDLLGWVTGNINHVYADRLLSFGWLGAVALAALLALARPLTLLSLGQEKAASAGVESSRVATTALIAVTLAAGSAVAVCGPISFVGLVAPHIVKPFAGAQFGPALIASALTGATICLIADLAARFVFAPFILHTAVILDLVGGIVFVAIVRRFYSQPKGGR